MILKDVDSTTIDKFNDGGVDWYTAMLIKAATITSSNGYSIWYTDDSNKFFTTYFPEDFPIQLS